MNFFFDLTTWTFLRDICVILALYLSFEHGLKFLRRSATRVRVTQPVSQRVSQSATQRVPRIDNNARY